MAKLASFKNACRRIAADCIHEDQEWVLTTCYSRVNRLSAAGVANKHAGVKGMPALDDERKTAHDASAFGTKKQRLPETKRAASEWKPSHQESTFQVRATSGGNRGQVRRLIMQD